MVVIGELMKVVVDLISGALTYLLQFMKWFYIIFLPFVIQYFGIPLFILGVILAVAFAGGTLFFTIIFFIFMYFFIKGTIFSSSP